MDKYLGLIGLDLDEAKSSLIIPFDELTDLLFGGQGSTSTAIEIVLSIHNTMQA